MSHWLDSSPTPKTFTLGRTAVSIQQITNAYQRTNRHILFDHTVRCCCCRGRAGDLNCLLMKRTKTFSPLWSRHLVQHVCVCVSHLTLLPDRVNGHAAPSKPTPQLNICKLYGMWKRRRRRLCRLLILSIYLKRDSLPLAPSERHKKKVEQRERGKEDTEAIGFYTHFSRLDTRGKEKKGKKKNKEKVRWLFSILFLFQKPRYGLLLLVERVEKSSNSQKEAEHWMKKKKKKKVDGSLRGGEREKQVWGEIIHLVLYLLHGHFTFPLKSSVAFCGSSGGKWRPTPPPHLHTPPIPLKNKKKEKLLAIDRRVRYYLCLWHRGHIARAPVVPYFTWCTKTLLGSL